MKENKNKLTWIFIPILIAVVFLTICFTLIFTKRSDSDSSKAKNLVIDTSATNIQKSNEELAQRQVHFPGIPDGTLSTTAPLILRNPASNEDIYLQYTIINDATGETLFETDLIESDKVVEWIPGQTLAPGNYSLTLVEQPYYMAEGAEGWLPLTTGNNHVNITIMD